MRTAEFGLNMNQQRLNAGQQQDQEEVFGSECVIGASVVTSLNLSKSLSTSMTWLSAQLVQSTEVI
jgi:hypothetical protein